MYKIFIPCEKSKAIARGFWQSDDGKICRDFIRYETIEKINNKILDEYKKKYNQEAIFYEVINNKTGKKIRAVCYYNRDKKDVFNRRIARYYDNRLNLIQRIRNFRCQKIINYTLEKIDGGFWIFTWIKRPDKKTRLRRRNKLIKNLIIKIIDKTLKNRNFEKTPLDNIKPLIGNTYRYTGYYQKHNNVIGIYPNSIKYLLIQKGISDNYYKGRGLKVNRYILRNYKTALRFTILHELGHAIFFEKYRDYKNLTKWENKTEYRERYADAFALRYIKEV